MKKLMLIGSGLLIFALGVYGYVRFSQSKHPEQWELIVDGQRYAAGCQGRPHLYQTDSGWAGSFRDNSDSTVYIDRAKEVSVIDLGKVTTAEPCFIGNQEYPAQVNLRK